jgi:surface antigen
VRRILVACTVLGIGLAGAARAAPPCFWPAEIEADQAVRLQIELMLVGETCHEPGYARFLERNRDALAAYQQILLERFARLRLGEAGEGALQSYLTRLANEASLRAGRAAGFCAGAADLVATVKGMQANDLRVYAAAQATASRHSYPVCGGSDAPIARVALAPPPTPPAPPPAPLPGGADEDGLLAALADDPLARRLDPADRREIRETTQRALEAAPSGQALAWRNPYSRNGGAVLVTRTYRDRGRWCRSFEQSVSVEGETRREHGAACRRPDGLAWDITP